jgi:hypothetical protein
MKFSGNVALCDVTSCAEFRQNPFSRFDRILAAQLEKGWRFSQSDPHRSRTFRGPYLTNR